MTASKKENGRLYVITPNTKVVAVLENLKQVKEFKLAYEPTAVEVTNDDKILYIGDSVNPFYISRC